MKLGAINGAALVVDGDRCAPVGEITNGTWVTPRDVFSDFQACRDAIERAGELPMQPFDPALLGPPVDAPGQVFGVGLNFTDHLEEAGRGGERPLPLTFTKFPSSLCGPTSDIEIPVPAVDYEVELVLVVGRDADRVPRGQGWDYVAGVTIGQDISARGVQIGGQLSLAKSFRTFAPIGPLVTTVDELADRDAMPMRCWVNGQLMQDTNTSLMVYDVAELIPFLSTFTTLRAGDLVFTGTGAGVGLFRSPPVFLQPGDLVESEIGDLGRMRNTCVAPTAEGADLAVVAALGAERLAARAGSGD